MKLDIAEVMNMNKAVEDAISHEMQEIEAKVRRLFDGVDTTLQNQSRKSPKVTALLIDSGQFPSVDLGRYSAFIASEIKKAGDEKQGILYALRVIPSFRKALFVVNEKYFIAELKTVYVGKKSKSRRKSDMGGTRIGVMSLEPIEYGAAEIYLSLNIKIQTERVAEILETTAERLRKLVSLIK